MNTVSLQEALRLAIRHHQAGQLAQAEPIYRQILQSQPDHPDALHLLGVIAHQVGQHEAAAELIGKAVRLAPQAPEYPANLGEALRALGRLDEAATAYRKAIRLNPKFAPAYNNLGIVLRQQGKNAEAITAFRRAIAVKPDYPQALNNLAIALKDQGDLAGAIEHYRRAISLAPSSPETHNNLGVTLKEHGLPEQALECFRQAIALNADFAPAYEGQGSALRAMGRFDEAIDAYRTAIRIDPRFAEAYNNLGVLLKDTGQSTEAILAYQQALALDPELAEAHNNLGIVLKEQGLLEQAIGHLQRALELRPGYAEACNNLGLALEIQGQVTEAIAAYRQALIFDPHLLRAHSNILFALNYLPRYDPQAIFEEHLSWSKTYAEALCSHKAAAPDRTADRIRIGYVSPDFRAHPVAYFIEAVLASHTPEQFEVTCYSDVIAPDEVTARLRRLAHHWRDIHGLTDEQACEVVRRDGIDILVDLAGHTDRNRLLLFARKPAPVQASWIGYFNTTGLAAMDYFISDQFSSPAGQERLFAEKLIRLPHSRFCYRPPDYAPEVAPPPSMKNSYITFGSFNNLAKINDDVVALWSEILSALPDSRLFLKSLALKDRNTRERYLNLFAAHGIAQDRISISEHSPHPEMLAEYGKIDIALDPFPFTGGLTTCETLWMGVPIVTLAGETLVSRQSASLLTNLGKTEWVAESPRRYVEIVLELAGTPTELLELRRNLRMWIAASPICDAEIVTRDLETTYRLMWAQLPGER